MSNSRTSVNTSINGNSNVNTVGSNNTKLIKLIKEGLDLLYYEDLCDVGQETYRKICAEIGMEVPKKDFIDDLSDVRIEDGGPMIFCEEFIEQINNDYNIQSKKDVLNLLNKNKENYRLALLDKDDAMIMWHEDFGQIDFD